MSNCTTESGTCRDCQSACQVKPGWFLPGEAEKVADHLGVSLEELFQTKLQVDWWEADHVIDQDVFLLSPAVVRGTPGQEFDANPNGVCVFFVKGRCSIHEVKPFECRQAVPCSDRDPAPDHQKIMYAWVDHQEQIKSLLGREPQS